MSDDLDPIKQDNIDEPQRAGASGSPEAPPKPSPVTESPEEQSSDGPSSADVDLLLRQAEEALASVDDPVETDIADLRPFDLEDFVGSPASTEAATLDLVRDVELDLKIELGRTHMYLEDVLQLRKGAVVPLDKLAGDPVDIYANGRLIARGEVLVLNDNFCVRVAELISGDLTPS